MWKEIFKPQHQNWRWVYCILQSIYFEVFSYLYQPYKGDFITYIWTSQQDFVFFTLFHFAITFFFCAVSGIVLPLLFPNFFIPERFTIARFAGVIASTGTLIALGFFYIYHVYFQSPMTLSWLLIFIFKLTPINIFFVGVPFIIVCLFVFNFITQSKENIKEQNAFRSHLPLEKTEETPPQYNDIPEPFLLTFTDTSNRKTLQIPLDKLHYITSAQNYIDVVYQNKKGEKTQTQLRGSLKAIEDDMINNKQIPLLRCHKAFIVNREKIVGMRGSLKVAQFILAEIDDKIPISRQKFAEYQSQFLTI
jgi:hypothetical protein